MTTRNSTLLQVSKSTQLATQIHQTYIIAYKESTQQLEDEFAIEGLSCEVVRQVHKEQFQGYSPSYLCLLNHRTAWEKATQSSGLTLIVEADFVPVVGLGKLPLPFKANQQDVGIAWLYTCAPQVYSVSDEGYAEGFSTSMVAYIITPASAKALLALSDEIAATSGPTAYSAWDSTVDKFLRSRGFKNYIPFRNYGEHGGKPNPEHRQNGLSPAHRADILYGRLAFMPPFAAEHQNPSLRLMAARLQARYKGLARLAAGKFLRPKIVRTSSVPLRLVKFAMRRQLSPRL